MSNNMEICLLRATDFRGKIYQRHYDHNVIIVCNHKDDSFIDVLELQQHISGHFSMILNNIHVKCMPPEDVWNMGHKQSSNVTIYNKYFKTVKDICQAIWMRTLRPTYVITDDEETAQLLSQNASFYKMYPSMKLCQPKLSRTVEGLCLEKPIDIRNPLHRLHLSGFFKTRKTLKFPVKKFLRDIPEQYILFFALGTYRRDYNYQHVIGALYTLIKHAKHNLTHKVFVALGGNFNDYNIQDEEYYHILLSSIRTDFERFNILFLDRLSTTDKKAMLRRSTAMIYLNSNPGYNPDLRLSLSVGCPIITLKAGYAEHVIVHGFSGFHMEKCEPTKLAVYMYRLTHPLKREYHGECARNHYIKEHTLTLYTLDSFREEDTPRPPPPAAQQLKKERKDIKGRNKSKNAQPVVEEPQVPLQPQVNVEIEPKKRILLYKSLSTTTLYPEMEKKKIERKPSLPNIKIEIKKSTKKAKAKVVVKSPSPSPQKKTEKAKPTKPKPKIIEEMDVTPRTRLLMKSKSTSKLNMMPKAPPKPPPRPAPKVYKRKPEPPSMIRAVGAFALKRDIPKEEPPKEGTSKDEPPEAQN